jgi:hypothetical protein
VNAREQGLHRVRVMTAALAIGGIAGTATIATVAAVSRADTTGSTSPTTLTSDDDDSGSIGSSDDDRSTGSDPGITGTDQPGQATSGGS